MDPVGEAQLTSVNKDRGLMQRTKHSQNKKSQRNPNQGAPLLRRRRIFWNFKNKRVVRGTVQLQRCEDEGSDFQRSTRTPSQSRSDHDRSGMLRRNEHGEHMGKARRRRRYRSLRGHVADPVPFWRGKSLALSFHEHFLRGDTRHKGSDYFVNHQGIRDHIFCLNALQLTNVADCLDVIVLVLDAQGEEPPHGVVLHFWLWRHFLDYIVKLFTYESCICTRTGTTMIVMAPMGVYRVVVPCVRPIISRALLLRKSLYFFSLELTEIIENARF